MTRLVEKTRNGGQWTEAKYRSFITSAIRSASTRWNPKYKAIDARYVRDGINPETGRKCKLHSCEGCSKLFPKGKLKADHIFPVVDPRKGFENWDTYIERMFCEMSGFQALCKACHDSKTAEEREIRKRFSPSKAKKNPNKVKSLKVESVKRVRRVR